VFGLTLPVWGRIPPWREWIAASEESPRSPSFAQSFFPVLFLSSCRTDRQPVRGQQLSPLQNVRWKAYIIMPGGVVDCRDILSI